MHFFSWQTDEIWGSRGHHKFTLFERPEITTLHLRHHDPKISSPRPPRTAWEYPWLRFNPRGYIELLWLTDCPWVHWRTRRTLQQLPPQSSFASCLQGIERNLVMGRWRLLFPSWRIVWVGDRAPAPQMGGRKPARVRSDIDQRIAGACRTISKVKSTNLEWRLFDLNGLDPRAYINTLLTCPVFASLFFSFLRFSLLVFFCISPSFLLLVLSSLDLISYLLCSFHLFSYLVLRNEPTR